MEFIEIRELSKTYGKGTDIAVEALKNVKLGISKGEMVGVMGISGSGKSTLLHIIGCMDTFDSGIYYLDGEDLRRYSKADMAQLRNQKIGFVLQEFGLIMNQSVYDNVIIPLIFSQKCSYKQMKEKVHQALVKVNISDLVSKRVEKLSGGQRQRVAIARALVNEPDLILADEPTAALDARTRDEIMDLFQTLHRQGKTVIIVSHDAKVAERCQRTISIIDGRVVT